MKVIELRRRRTFRLKTYLPDTNRPVQSMKARSISLACLVVLDSVEATVKGYKNFDDFLAEIKVTADSFLDYVTKMQALFCPNQPVCGGNGELERKDVLGTLPTAALSIDNVSVAVEDLAQSVGVCCLPCSCADSCRQDENCCPTKQLLPDTNNDSTVVKSECIVASARSYSDKTNVQTFDKHHMYRMITDCFHDNNHTLLDRCQHPDDHALADRVPVTSQLTGLTYWNRPCALCNADADYIVDWTPNVWVKTILPYFAKTPDMRWLPDTHKLLSQLLGARKVTDVIYTPPVDISTKDQVCVRDGTFRERYCSNDLPEDDWLSEACTQFYSPAFDTTGYTLRNIFCLLCHSSIQLEADYSSCSGGEGAKAESGYLIGLLNYKFEPETTTEKEMVERKCDCAEMYDPYLKRCRLSFCPAGQIREGCHCIAPFRNISGMPVTLMAKVMTDSEQLNPLKRGQLRKLYSALTDALESMTQNTTAEVATTLRQENVTTQTYLSIVVVQSDPGFDTKLAMRPFLDYLDTDNVLELTVGDLNFTAALTTQAKIWVNKSTTGMTRFGACCLEQKPNELVQIYVNKGAMKLIGYDTGSYVYQLMSRLLFCYQVHLDPIEYVTMNTGIVKVKVTDPMISISDYYPVIPSGIRVCIDTYVAKAPKEGSKSAGTHAVPFVVGLLFVSVLASGPFLCTGQ